MHIQEIRDIKCRKTDCFPGCFRAVPIGKTSFEIIYWRCLSVADEILIVSKSNVAILLFFLLEDGALGLLL